KMTAALDDGSSLIVFPEGTRNQDAAQLQPFKSGLYHLAKARPEVELVPVWIDNLHRVMPKGEFLPVPLLCSVRFGSPLSSLRRAADLARGRAQERIPRAGAQRAARARPAGRTVMSAHDKTLYLFEGVAAVLAIAWLIGWLLERRFVGSGPNSVIENLNARI